MSVVLLSFCIPTYNRGEFVYENVKRILGYSSNRIEVVVSDNASSDKTKNLLSGIDDERFSYYRNETNIGAIKNICKVLMRGKGKYLFLLSDEDEVVLQSIDRLIEVLEVHSDVSVVRGRVEFLNGKDYVSMGGKRDEYYDSLMGKCVPPAFYWMAFYMSALIIKSNCLSYDVIGKFIKEDYKYIYPQICLLLKALECGKSIWIETSFCILGRTQGYKDISTIKDEISSNKEEIHYHYEPISRKAQMLFIIDFIFALNTKKTIKLDYINDAIKAYCWGSILAFEDIIWETYNKGTLFTTSSSNENLYVMRKKTLFDGIEGFGKYFKIPNTLMQMEAYKSIDVYLCVMHLMLDSHYHYSEYLRKYRISNRGYIKIYHAFYIGDLRRKRLEFLSCFLRRVEKTIVRMEKKATKSVEELFWLAYVMKRNKKDKKSLLYFENYMEGFNKNHLDCICPVYTKRYFIIACLEMGELYRKFRKNDKSEAYFRQGYVLSNNYKEKNKKMEKYIHKLRENAQRYLGYEHV